MPEKCGRWRQVAVGGRVSPKAPSEIHSNLHVASVIIDVMEVGIVHNLREPRFDAAAMGALTSLPFQLITSVESMNLS